VILASAPGDGLAQPDAAVRIVDLLDAPPERRVRLRLMALEVDRDHLQDLKIDLQALLTRTDGPASTEPVSELHGAPGVHDHLPIAEVFESAEIGVLVDWLVRNAASRVVARSTLVVPEGQTASFETAAALPAEPHRGAGPEMLDLLSGFSAAARAVFTADGDDAPIRLDVWPEYNWQAIDHDAGPLPEFHFWRSAAHGVIEPGQVLVVTNLASSASGRRLPFLGELPSRSTQTAPRERGASAAPGTDLLLLIAAEKP
jgi:hypothetical protein